MKKIKNGFVIIDSSTIEEIKNIRQSKWGGFFYVVEWGCNQVKIGMTKNPYKRYKSLSSVARAYNDISIGKIMLSPEHYNYEENEKKLHESFKSIRHNTCSEIFDINFNQIVNLICNHDTEENINITFDCISEQKEIELEEKSEQASKFFRSFVHGDLNNEFQNNSIKGHDCKSCYYQITDLMESFYSICAIDFETINKQKKLELQSVIDIFKIKNVEVSIDENTIINEILNMFDIYGENWEYRELQFCKIHFITNGRYIFTNKTVSYDLLDIIFDNEYLSYRFHQFILQYLKRYGIDGENDIDYQLIFNNNIERYVANCSKENKKVQEFKEEGCELFG